LFSSQASRETLRAGFGWFCYSGKPLLYGTALSNETYRACTFAQVQKALKLPEQAHMTVLNLGLLLNDDRAN